MRSKRSLIPSSKKMWARHEELVLGVFGLALEMLRNRTDLPKDEPAMNELLALEARQATFILHQDGRGLPFPPRWENPRQPRSEADLGQSKKAKRPDFSYPFRNTSANSARDAYLDYDIECKLLGRPSSPGWNFNRNYVENGIVRFLDPQHRYGDGTHSGAMIGYVQSMDLKSILVEVNRHIRSSADYDIPLMTFRQEFGVQPFARTSQQLLRKRVLPSTFDLRHLWVDLRP